MGEQGEYPLLVLPGGVLVPPVVRKGGGGGSKNPSKARQIERLGPQFLELQRAAQARTMTLSEAAVGAGPEHILVFETNGSVQKLYDALAKNTELEWLFDYDKRRPSRR